MTEEQKAKSEIMAHLRNIYGDAVYVPGDILDMLVARFLKVQRSKN